MPGRNPAEAIINYIRPLQQSLSCLTRAVIRPSGYDRDILLTATFNQPNIELLTSHDEVLHLSFIQTFRTERTAFEEFALMLIDYFYVVPERPDAAEVLQKNWRKFKHQRAWAGY